MTVVEAKINLIVNSLPNRLAHARHVDELNGCVVPRLFDVHIEYLSAAVELVPQVGGQAARAR